MIIKCAASMARCPRSDKLENYFFSRREFIGKCALGIGARAMSICRGALEIALPDGEIAKCERKSKEGRG